MSSVNVVKRLRGRPKLRKLYPNKTHMRISEELEALLKSEKQPSETLGETALRLIRERGKKVVALAKELDQYRSLENKNVQVEMIAR